MRREEQNYVELRRVSKRFDGVPVTREVSLGIPRGTLAALLGPSGSGKTTLLRMIAGLEQPDAGEILINGQVVNGLAGSERGVGFVFQNYALFRYMTVYENIAFGLRVKKMSRREIDQRVRELIYLIGCEGLEKRYPSQLSGGQRQRVAFARSLAPRPRLLLLDEPFAAVDSKIRVELRVWLRDMIGQLGITSLFVTHDQEEAMEVADEIIVTNQGRVEQTGSPRALYTAPATPFVAGFIGQSVRIEDCGCFRAFPLGGHSGAALVRPEFVSIAKKGERAWFSRFAEEGVIESAVFRGDRVALRIRLNGALIPAMRGVNEAPVSVGERVDVFLHRMYLLEGEKVTLLENASGAAETA